MHSDVSHALDMTKEMMCTCHAERSEASRQYSDVSHALDMTKEMIAEWI